jgi:hypothetical protein
MRRATPFPEALDDDASVVETGFEIAVIMAAMTVAASVCSGIVTLAWMA